MLIMTITRSYSNKVLTKSETIKMKITVLLCCRTGSNILSGKQGKQHFHCKVSEYLLVHSRSFVMFLDHSTILVLTWTLQTQLNTSTDMDTADTAKY